jgi:hypoxanthine-DNA glycosylase
MSEIKEHGFGPVYDNKSKILILGSFPSVLSRKIQFYYGNPQNHFWRTLEYCLGGKSGETIEEKKRYVLNNRIALWDIIDSCVIEGSSDASIKQYKTANIGMILDAAPIQAIFCNGKTSYSLTLERIGAIEVPIIPLPSTSPANPRFDREIWKEAFEKYLF